MLKLFDAADPERLLEERRLAGGALVVGREPGAEGWTLNDPDRLISRSHCVFELREGALTVRDLSSNGLVREADASRLERDADVALAVGDVLRLGRLCIRVEADPGPSPFAPPAGVSPIGTVIRMAPVGPPALRGDQAAKPMSNDFDALFTRPMLGAQDPAETTAVVPTDWGGPGPAAARTGLPDAALLEAFCAGAKLDLSNFVGEDPCEVMRSLGEVYRQMVLGVSDLMTERVTVKSEYRMTRTTVRSENNNLFKWAGAQRVAVDLLRQPAEGFLAGPAAVNECFADLKKHVLCMMAGLRASVSATLHELDPDTLAPSGGLFGVGRGTGDVYRKRHAQVSATVASDPNGPVNRAFRDAYEKRLRELDSTGCGAAPQAASAR